MTVTLTTGQPQELLALIPFQLGFHPHESAVLVGLRGPRQAVGLLARVELAELAGGSNAHELARAIIWRLREDEATAAVLVLYTEAAVGRVCDEADAAWRAQAAVQAAADESVRGGAALALAETWVVGPEGYHALGCLDLLCCPAGGRSLDDLRSTVVGAHMVLAGATVARRREDLAEVVPADPEDCLAASRGARLWRRVLQSDQAACRVWQQESLRLWRCCLEGTPGAWSPEDLGRLAAAFDDGEVRDAVLLSWTDSAGDLPDRFLVRGGPAASAAGGGPEGSAEVDGAVARALATIVDPVAGARPDPGRMAAVCHLLTAIVSHGHATPAPVRTLLAMAWWWQADMTRAGAHLEQALQADPEYRLAAILRRALDADLRPGWLSAGWAG